MIDSHNNRESSLPASRAWGVAPPTLESPEKNLETPPSFGLLTGPETREGWALPATLNRLVYC